MDYSLQTLQSYAVNVPGSAEVIRQRLYDFQLYATAGAAQFTFFTNPIGQGVTTAQGAAVGSAKTYADTNMETSGSLPRPKNYLLESIEVIFEPGSVNTASTYTPAVPNQFAAANAATVINQLQDINLIRQSGWLELFIGSKTYLTEAPLGTFPPKVRMEMDAALATTSATAGEIAAISGKWGGRPYYLDPPIALESLQNFAVYVKFPGAVATPSGFNARIGVVFDGVMYRNAQ